MKRTTTGIQRNGHATLPMRWQLSGTLADGRPPQRITVTETPFHIGRREGMNLVLSSLMVSSAHAELIIMDDELFVRDCGSTNGTYVNGDRIHSSLKLTEGDILEIGDVLLRVEQRFGVVDEPITHPLVTRTCFLGSSNDPAVRRAFRRVMDERSVLPCFQAIHCLATGQVRGYEFLARSAEPGVESAGALFETARQANREVELSLMCRERAVAFSYLLEPGIPVFMNSHPAEPLLEVTVPHMQELQRRYPDRPLVLEIHEAALTDPSMIRNVRNRLAESGIRLAFDDFGRGQARIRELICSSSDYIKFDAALIRDLESVSPDQFRFFRSIIQGIRGEGAITVAEGVETESMADVCRRIGFDLVQGYLFGRPTIMTQT